MTTNNDVIFRKETGDTGFNKTPFRVFRASCYFNPDNKTQSCILQIKANEDMKIDPGMVFEVRRPKIVKAMSDIIVSFVKETSMEEITPKTPPAAIHRKLIPCSLNKVEAKNPLFPNEFDCVGIVVDCKAKSVVISNARHCHIKIETDVEWKEAMLLKEGFHMKKFCRFFFNFFQISFFF